MSHRKTRMADKNTDLSIIVPLYNDEETIEKCIDSIDIPSDYVVEIIVVDDKSTDHSLEIAKAVGKKKKHLKIFSLKNNSGPNIARRHGVNKALGKYVMFLDADDELAHDACKVLLDEVKDRPADILHFSMRVAPSDKAMSDAAKGIEKWLTPPDRTMTQKELVNLCFHERTLSWNICGKLFSSKVCRLAFSQISDKRYLRAEDLYTFLVVALKSKTYIGRPDLCLYIYNYGLGGDGNKSVTLTDYTNNWLSLPSLYNDILAFFEQHKIETKYPSLPTDIKNILIDDCVDFLIYRIPAHNKRTAYSRLIDAWEDVDVNQYISKRLNSQKKRLLFGGLKASLFYKKNMRSRNV